MWKVKLERIKKLDYHWIPLIKLKDIRDVFVGKDIIKGYVQEQANRNQTFRPSKIYESFTGNHNEWLQCKQRSTIINWVYKDQESSK